MILNYIFHSVFEISMIMDKWVKQTKSMKSLHCVKTCKTEYVYNSRHIVLWLNHASFVTQGLALLLFM